MKIERDKFVDTSSSNKVGFMLMHVINEDKALEIVNSMTYNEEQIVDVTLTINGVELDIEDVLTRLYDMYDYNVANAAKRMFKEVVSEKISSITDALNEIESKAESINDSMSWDSLWNEGYFKEEFCKK